jgi:cell division protein FtsN
VAPREAKAAPKAPPADKDRFDFYKILPGGEEPKIAGKAPAGRSEAAKAPEKVAAAEPSATKAAKPGDRFWLQAGSFTQEGDAENLRAQLALAGWEAQVQPGTLPDKGVRYRVRLGPYDNADELNRVKAQLAQRGFEAAVIKF